MKRPRPGETPAALARRLALAKARAVAELHPGMRGDRLRPEWPTWTASPLGKPGTHERAIAAAAAHARANCDLPDRGRRGVPGQPALLQEASGSRSR